jgi:hypothetical protein
VFPGDREHRKRIFALAGDHGPKAIRVKVAVAQTSGTVQLDLSAFAAVAARPDCKITAEQPEIGEVGTPGTGISNPRAYAVEPVVHDITIRKLIEFETPVPSVPKVATAEIGATGGSQGSRMPFLMVDGTLVIPFESPERYHWWKGGQSVRETVAELKERKELHGSPF